MDKNFEIIELLDEDIEEVEERLEKFDFEHIRYKLQGRVSLGIKDNGRLIAGLDACVTAFKILYISTVYVDEEYRGRGIGKLLMEEAQKRATQLGINMIRLDTFNWQGRDFYKSLGYEEVGCYENREDGFSEHFFLKRI